MYLHNLTKSSLLINSFAIERIGNVVRNSYHDRVWLYLVRSILTIRSLYVILAPTYNAPASPRSLITLDTSRLWAVHVSIF